MILESLFIKLGYDYDGEQLEEFNKKVDATGRFLKRASLAGIGLATTLAVMLQRTASVALGQQRLGEAINLTREEVEALNRTSRDITGDEDSIVGFIQKLVDARRALKGQGAVDEGLARAMGMLNLQYQQLLSENPLDLLLKMTEAFQEVGTNTSAEDSLINLLGLSNEMVRVFRKLEESQIRANMPVDLDEANIERVSLLFNQLRDDIEDSVSILMVDMLPAFETVVKGLGILAPKLASAATVIAEAFVGLGEWMGESIAILHLAIIDLQRDFKQFINDIDQALTDFLVRTPSGDIDFLETIKQGIFSPEEEKIIRDYERYNGPLGETPGEGFVPTFDVLPESSNQPKIPVKPGQATPGPQSQNNETTNHFYIDIASDKSPAQIADEVTDRIITVTGIATAGRSQS